MQVWKGIGTMQCSHIIPVWIVYEPVLSFFHFQFQSREAYKADPPWRRGACDWLQSWWRGQTGLKWASTTTSEWESTQLTRNTGAHSQLASDFKLQDGGLIEVKYVMSWESDRKSCKFNMMNRMWLMRGELYHAKRKQLFTWVAAVSYPCRNIYHFCCVT